MKKTLLIVTLLATAASAQTVPPLEPQSRESAPIASAPEKNPADGAIIPADDALPAGAMTLEGHPEDDALPTDDEAQGFFRQEFTVTRNAQEYIYCGGDLPDKNNPYPTHQGLRCITQTPISAKLARKAPADCELDWGATFALGAHGKTEILWECRINVDFSRDDVFALEDGNSVDGGGWQCTRRANELTCKNSDKHGFTIGDKGQKVF